LEGSQQLDQFVSYFEFTEAIIHKMVVRFEVLTAESMKMAAFWVVAIHRPGNGGSEHLSNVGKRLSDYMAQQPRRQPTS
jgi:hypothetical protein